MVPPTPRGYPPLSAEEKTEERLAAKPKPEQLKNGKVAHQKLIQEGRPISDELVMIVRNALT